MNRRIGGSVLPSSSPEIFRPLAGKNGLFYVKALVEEDTHALYFKEKHRNERMIAAHPNGFSCFALAQLIIQRNIPQAIIQANFMVECGGASLNEFDLYEIIY